MPNVTTKAQRSELRGVIMVVYSTQALVDSPIFVARGSTTDFSQAFTDLRSRARVIMRGLPTACSVATLS
jgi:hypothetical protein